MPVVSVLLILASCASPSKPANDMGQVQPVLIQELPRAAPSDYPAADVERGRYLVTLLGCGSCHTDGALIGKPNAERALAGSGVGIARSDPLVERSPGVVYPSNITPDHETGIGAWTPQEIARLLQSGMNRHGSPVVPVMPWLNFARLSPEDALAIAMYLKALPPVNHRVPATVQPGQKATAPFVHFGVYQSRE
jgi:mono/diheme cytochrome c family protein